MVFSSIPFLFFFLPLVMLIYFITPFKYRNLILLVTSLVFYGWGEPENIIVMIISIFTGYITGLLIEKNRNTYKSKLYCYIAVIIQILFFTYYKYSDFIIGNINSITGMKIPLLKIVLPIGISFYPGPRSLPPAPDFPHSASRW